MLSLYCLHIKETVSTYHTIYKYMLSLCCLHIIPFFPYTRRHQCTQCPCRFLALEERDIYLGLRVDLGRAHHFFDNMVDAHCVRDEGRFAVQWLVFAFHWVTSRVRGTIALLRGHVYDIYHSKEYVNNFFSNIW